MPELPEVETIVRGLRPRLIGRRVTRLWSSGFPLRLARPIPLAAVRSACLRRRITGVRRLGKYVLIDLEVEKAPAGVAVHLGMSGRLRIHAASEPRAAHTHLVWGLDGGHELRFVDPRLFGWVGAAAPPESLPELALLGPDPLTHLDERELTARLRGVRAPIKAFLLDQRRIAGLGNIYVCEALYRSGIHPATPAGRLGPRAGELLSGIRDALERGIANRGTSLRDYVDATGLPGDNQQALLVYGRAGEPCGRCGAAVKRRIDAGRSTFFCPRCQTR
jgi:formamidopyrimidine-DNA glycosylase